MQNYTPEFFRKILQFPLNVTVFLQPTKRHISNKNYRQKNLVLLRFSCIYDV